MMFREILPNGILPGDLMINILLNLPVRSLLRFRAVSKSWYVFLTSLYFIEMYRQRTTTHKLLASSYRSESGSLKISFSDVNDNNVVDYASFHDIPLPYCFRKDDEVDFHSSCNGLVCMSVNWLSSIFLCNPATRKFRTLEIPKHLEIRRHSFHVGLGYLSATHDYKVVIIYSQPREQLAYSAVVYTLSSDSWKQLEDISPYVQLEPGPTSCLNGCLHWLATRDLTVTQIAVFDADKEVFQYMEAPKIPGSKHKVRGQLMVIKGLLSMIFTYPDLVNSPPLEVRIKHFEIWTMTEYGIQASWTKQFHIEPLPLMARPIGILNDVELIFGRSFDGYRQIFTYDPFTRRIRHLRNLVPIFSVTYDYAETLESVYGGRGQPEIGEGAGEP